MEVAALCYPCTMVLLLLATAHAPALAVPEVPASTPDVDALVAAWEAWTPTMDRQARIPVHLGRTDLERVARGDVARERTQLEGIDRVVGATWTDQPRDALWVAILDDACDTLIDGLTELHLRAELPGQKILFQHVDLPWPFADRQWIIDIRNNRDLYRSTGGAVWERTWTLADRQDARRAEVPGDDMPAPDAVWTPLNQGGWLLLDAAGGTLVVYHGRADVGGSIPDDLSTRFALATLKGMLLHAVERAGQVPAHYDTGHAPIERPDGSRVPGW